MITIFTDGSSRGNPGPGGWGCIIVKKNSIESSSRVFELGGRDEHTTNNRMELMAAIRSLEELGSRGDIEATEQIVINTDSSYVINGITKWVHGWKKKNWKTLDKKDVVNKDLWEALDKNIFGKKITWNYVGGHVGVIGNERCDVIATSFADNNPIELYSGPFVGYPIKNILDISISKDVLQKKTTAKSHSNAPAYSYVSKVDGTIYLDKTWKECEARVKGKRGARYKKALSSSQECDIINDFK